MPDKLQSQKKFSDFFYGKTDITIPLKTGTAMNAKISVFVICVEAITYLLLYNLHDFAFNDYTSSPQFNILL